MPRNAATPIVIRFGALGDMVLLTPLLRQLHRRYGRPCHVVGSGAWLEPLFATHPDVSGTLVLASRKRPYWLDPSQHRLVARLREPSPGPVYVCDDYAVDKIRWLLDRARVSAGQCVFANPGCRLRDGDHWIDRWHRFGAMTPAAFAGTPEADAPDAPYLTVDPADRLELDAWLRANGCENAPLVLLQPGNKRTLKRGRIGQIGDPKRWPSANWTALVRAILERCPDARIVLCGTPREARLLGAIAAAAHSDRVLSSTDGPTLRRLLALCERAVGMISIDSGPAHAAAALGCPLIVLYGPARPSLWLPRSPTDSAVVALGGLPGRDRVDQIAPDEAVAAWRALPLRNHAGGHGGIPA